jgi:uncharacterized membrane protein YqiK
VEEERIAREREVQQLEIARRQAIELAEQQRAIAVAEQSKAQSEAQAAADLARAKAVSEEERVFTARETEMAERRKRIELIGAAQEAERVRTEAEGQAASEKTRALAARIRHEVEAEGLRLMNEAQNLLSPEARLSAMRLRLIDKLDAIIRESVKPMERIEGIKILQVDGLGGGGGGRGDGREGGSLADSVVNSALRYRAQAPLVDQLLREIGIDAGDVGKVARGLLDRGQPAALSGAGDQGTAE